MAMNRPLDGRDNLRRAGKSLRSDSAKKALSHESTRTGSVMEKRFALYASEGHRLPFWAMRNDHLWTSRNGNPQRKRSKSGSYYSSDVDFVFANGNKIIFVDVKGYAASKFYWTAFFANDYRVREGLTGFKTDKNDKITSMSSSMNMAVNQYSELLPDADIKAIILFVPVGKVRSGTYGEPADPRKLPGNVTFLRGTGGVRSYKMEEGFREINKHLGIEEHHVPRHIQDVLDQHAMK